MTADLATFVGAGPAVERAVPLRSRRPGATQLHRHSPGPTPTPARKNVGPRRKDMLVNATHMAARIALVAGTLDRAGVRPISTVSLHGVTDRIMCGDSRGRGVASDD